MASGQVDYFIDTMITIHIAKVKKRKSHGIKRNYQLCKPRRKSITQWDKYLAYAENPDSEFVISNTTE